MKEIEILIEGGKATPAPPIGPTLAPMGVNVGGVVDEINKKTKNFSGMKVPVKITVQDDKSFEIEVGTPPVSALIKKELELEKGSQKPGEEFVADMKIEQIIKIAKMKQDSMLAKDLKAAVKQVIGSCASVGVMVEGKPAKEAIKDVDQGKYNKEIREEKIELSKEELKELEEEKKKLAEEIEKKHEEEARLAAEEEAKKAAAAEEAEKEVPVEEKAEEAEKPEELPAAEEKEEKPEEENK